MPYGDQFAESLFYDYPRSDLANGCWWFGDSALRCVSIDGIRRRPFVGHITGETKRGDATNALMDMLPEGSVFVSTVVVIPQDTLEAHIDDIDESAIGDNSESIQVRKDCARGLGQPSGGHIAQAVEGQARQAGSLHDLPSNQAK